MTTTTRQSRFATPSPTLCARRPHAPGCDDKGNTMKPLLRLLTFAFVLVAPSLAQAEDGYDLWLRYRPLEKASLDQYRPLVTGLMPRGASPTIEAARDEMQRGLSGL